MKCPLCQTKLKVSNTQVHVGYVRRLRECPECLSQFPSMEKILFNEVSPYLLNKLHEVNK